MPPLVCAGALLQCPFGVAPAPLVVLPARRVTASSLPVGTINDMVPVTNVPTFGMCSSPANPTVAAATAAALGVLTPMPCLPAPTGPWTPAAPTSLVAGEPALALGATLVCAWGGVIQISSPGQPGTTLGA